MDKKHNFLTQLNGIISLLSPFFLWISILGFGFLYFFNSIFESYWEEVGVNNISCKALEIPNCTEVNGTAIIRNVYTKNALFDNRVQLTVHSKDKSFVMLVRDDAFIYRVHSTKKN